jgi:hypothetical protein
MRLTRHVARKGEEKEEDNAHRVLVRNAERDHYENLDENKLRGLSPQANSNERATATCRRS